MPDPAAYERVHEVYPIRVSGVASIETGFALNRAKHSTALPQAEV